MCIVKLLLFCFQLFDHIADCIANFMKEQNLMGKSEPLPLGFTFSFPCKQEGLAVGRLVRWTKGFCCEGVQGEDVVRLLQEAIARRQVCNKVMFKHAVCVHCKSDYVLYMFVTYK